MVSPETLFRAGRAVSGASNALLRMKPAFKVLAFQKPIKQIPQSWDNFPQSRDFASPSTEGSRLVPETSALLLVLVPETSPFR